LLNARKDEKYFRVPKGEEEPDLVNWQVDGYGEIKTTGTSKNSTFGLIKIGRFKAARKEVALRVDNYGLQGIEQKKKKNNSDRCQRNGWR
jgi:hypothetical protein